MGFSGTKTISAPQARPAFNAICPALRPITSTIATRSWEFDVSRIRPTASTTVLRAVS